MAEKIPTAVILAGGKGLRLWPLTETVPKPLLQIAGKSMLERIILSLKDAGIKKFVVIADYLMDKIEFSSKEYSKLHGVEIKVIKQIDKKGTASAIYSAKGHVSGDFLVASGDHILDGSIYKDMLKQHSGSDLVGLKTISDPRGYGVCVVEKGKISLMEEKPKSPKSNLINIGIYIFNEKIFKDIEGIRLSPRGEHEITDILTGKNAFSTDKYWIDVGYPWNMLDANSWILQNAKEEFSKSNVENSTIKGKLVLGKNSKVINSYIEGNVFIGENTVIGPFAYIKGDTSIGNDCAIGPGTSVKNSILGNKANAKHLTYIGDSVIGNNVNFGASTQVANLRFDEQNVKIETFNTEIKDSGRKKFGIVTGDNVRFGINSSIMPGILISSNSFVMSGTTVLKNIRKI